MKLPHFGNTFRKQLKLAVLLAICYNFNNYVYQNNKDLLLTAILNLYFILNNKKGQKI